MVIERRRPIDPSIERQLITGMIVSDEFIQEIKPLLKQDSLTLPYAQTICDWCLTFYDNFGSAPGANIKDIFIEKKKHQLNDDVAELIEDFLSSISEEYARDEVFNAKYYLNKSKDHLRSVSLNKLAKKIQKAVTGGRLEEAEALAKGYQRVEIIKSKGIDPLFDSEFIASIFDENDTDSLFSFPGALGRAIGPLKRGWLFAFVGSAKTGKCLTKDSMITLDDGRLKPLKYVIDNKASNTVSMNNDFKIVKSNISEFYSNGIKPIVEVTTKTGRKIKLTRNHPLFDLNYGWISIDDGLKIGDCIAVPKTISVFGNKKLPINHVNLIAYLLADGGLTGSEVTFTKKEKEIKDDVIRIITELGDCYRIDDELTISINKGKKCYSPEKTKTKKMLIKYNIPFCKSIYKVIPDCIFTLPKPQLKEFLKTLFTGDGSIFDFGIEYCSGSEEMIRQISHLLLRFGIIGKVRGKFNKRFNKTYWTFSILDSFYIKKFIKEIGFNFSKGEKAELIFQKALNKKKRSYYDGFPCECRDLLIDKINKSGLHKKQFKSVGNKHTEKGITYGLLDKSNKVLKDEYFDKLLNADVFFDKIVSIEDKGFEETYDITIPGYHNFIANDIMAHNTWWLMLTGLRALFAGYNVLFLSLEMSEKEMGRRIQHYINSAPTRKWAGEMLIPVFDCEKNQKGTCTLSKRISKKDLTSKDGMIENFDDAPANYKPCTVCMDLKNKEFKCKSWFRKTTKEELTLEKALKKKTALKRSAMIRGAKFRLIEQPSGKYTMNEFRSLLYNLEHYENFVPDIIITDYADKFKSESRDYRHGINEVWEGHKGLAQEKNCLVVTASQSNTARTGKDIGQGAWAEDIRKLNLIDVGIGLNMTPEEKKMGIMRALVMAQRHDYFDTLAQVKLLHQLKIGRPYLDSYSGY